MFEDRPPNTNGVVGAAAAVCKVCSFSGVVDKLLAPPKLNAEDCGCCCCPPKLKAVELPKTELLLPVPFMLLLLLLVEMSGLFSSFVFIFFDELNIENEDGCFSGLFVANELDEAVEVDDVLEDPNKNGCAELPVD